MNRRNDKVIGTISELLIDRNGQIGALIVSAGGVTGAEQKDLVIAWDQVERGGRERSPLSAIRQTVLAKPGCGNVIYVRDRTDSRRRLAHYLDEPLIRLLNRRI